MKRFLAVVVGVALMACTNIEMARVESSEVIASQGEAVAVIQASSMGWTFFWHLLTVAESNLDEVVNKMLVAEAKALGADKIELKSASTDPRGGIWGLPYLITGPITSQAVGIAVKTGAGSSMPTSTAMPESTESVESVESVESIGVE